MNFLYDHRGQRKYLTVVERERFLTSARAGDPKVYTFCATLAYTGARISEVLALVPDRFDFADQIVVIECLKKRRRGFNRAVPLPSIFLQELNDTHKLHCGLSEEGRHPTRLWPWGTFT